MKTSVHVTSIYRPMREDIDVVIKMYNIDIFPLEIVLLQHFCLVERMEPSENELYSPSVISKYYRLNEQLLEKEYDMVRHEINYPFSKISSDSLITMYSLQTQVYPVQNKCYHTLSHISHSDVYTLIRPARQSVVYNTAIASKIFILNFPLTENPLLYKETIN